MNEHAAQIEKAIKDALQETVSTKLTTPKKPWISEETKNLADEKRKAKQIKHLSIEHNKTYKHLCQEVKQSARQDKDKWIQEQCEEIEKGLQIGNSRKHIDW